MKSTYFMSFLLLGAFSVSGQNDPDAQSVPGKFGSAASGVNGPIGVFEDQKTIGGTPYLFEEWYNGEITFLNDKNMPVEKLRYDIYKDELLVFRNKDEMGILPKNLIKSFTLHNPKGTGPLRYIKAGQIPVMYQMPEEQFLQVLYQSESIGLFAHYWKSFHKADERATYYTEKVVDEFSDPKQELFLVKKDGSVHELMLRRGAILSTLKEQKSALKSFIRDNQLSFADTDDLIKLIKYYETLTYAEPS